jgi:hypothetical protein
LQSEVLVTGGEKGILTLWAPGEGSSPDGNNGVVDLDDEEMQEDDDRAASRNDAAGNGEPGWVDVAAAENDSDESTTDEDVPDASGE